MQERKKCNSGFKTKGVFANIQKEFHCIGLSSVCFTVKKFCISQHAVMKQKNKTQLTREARRLRHCLEMDVHYVLEIKKWKQSLKLCDFRGCFIAFDEALVYHLLEPTMLRLPSTYLEFDCSPFCRFVHSSFHGMLVLKSKSNPQRQMD